MEAKGREAVFLKSPSVPALFGAVSDGDFVNSFDQLSEAEYNLRSSKSQSCFRALVKVVIATNEKRFGKSESQKKVARADD